MYIPVLLHVHIVDLLFCRSGVRTRSLNNTYAWMLVLHIQVLQLTVVAISLIFSPDLDTIPLPISSSATSRPSATSYPPAVSRPSATSHPPATSRQSANSHPPATACLSATSHPPVATDQWRSAADYQQISRCQWTTACHFGSYTGF